jgi:hypothetical protein
MTIGAHFLAIRYLKGARTTVSMVSESGKHVCQFLEDEIRTDGEKIPGMTAIPTGRYRLGVTHNSPMSMRYYARWPDSWYKGLPTLEWDHPEGAPMVPRFDHLRVHPGTDHTDSAGCPLTASEVVLVESGDYQAVQSVRAFERFATRLYDGLEVGDCYLTIQDHTELRA